MSGDRPVRHVTIAGDLGSGKSAVAEAVGLALDIQTLSAGSIQRSIANRLSLSTLEANLLAERDRAIDTEVDAVTRSIARDAKSPLIMDSRMAWHILPESLKVRLVVDPEVAAARVVARGPGAAEDYPNLEVARDAIRKRYESEVRRFWSRYGVDIAATQNFDLVIDTSDSAIGDVAAYVVDAYRTTAANAHTVMISPKRLVPTDEGLLEASAGHAVQVKYVRPFFLFVDGANQVKDAIREGANLIDVEVVADASSYVASDRARATRLTSERALNAWRAATGSDSLSYRNWWENRATQT